jgi:hypothetical protein
VRCAAADQKAERLLNAIALSTLAEDKRKSLAALQDLAERTPDLTLSAAGFRQLIDCTRPPPKQSASALAAAGAGAGAGDGGEGAAAPVVSIADADGIRTVTNTIYPLLVRQPDSADDGADGPAPSAAQGAGPVPSPSPPPPAQRNPNISHFLQATPSGASAGGGVGGAGGLSDKKSKSESKSYGNVSRLIEISKQFNDKRVRLFSIQIITALVIADTHKVCRRPPLLRCPSAQHSTAQLTH